MMNIKILVVAFIGILSVAVATGIWIVLEDDSARVQQMRSADIAAERKAIEEAEKAHPNPFKAQ